MIHCDLLVEIMSKRPPSYPLRIPDGTREFLEEQADKKSISLQREIMERIEFAIQFERNYSKYLGSLDNAGESILRLISKERKLDDLMHHVAHLENELEHQKQLNRKLIASASEGLEGKERRLKLIYQQVQKMKSDMEDLLGEDVDR